MWAKKSETCLIMGVHDTKRQSNSVFRACCGQDVYLDAVNTQLDLKYVL